MTLNKGYILEGHLTAGENFGRYPTAVEYIFVSILKPTILEYGGALEKS